MVGLGIGRGKHDRGKALLATFAPKDVVAGHEDIALGDRGVTPVPIADGERFQKTAVGEIDATVDRAEGMAACRCDGETQCGKAGAGARQVCGRQNQVIERERIGTSGHSDHLPQPGARRKPGRMPCASSDGLVCKTPRQGMHLFRACMDGRQICRRRGCNRM